MDKNNLIGITLIFLLFFAWAQYNAPSEAEMKEIKRQQDSIAMVQAMQDSLAELPETAKQELNVPEADEPDSLRQLRLNSKYGVFTPSITGSEKLETFENDLFKVTLSNKGGKIKEVLLKNYHKIAVDENGKESKIPLFLLEDEKNKFEYYLPVAGAANGSISSGDLYFQPSWNGNTLIFKALTTSGGYFEQSYTFNPDTYGIDYKVKLEGLENVMPRNTNEIDLFWVNYLDKLERNFSYEKNYSSIYFRTIEDDEPDYCSCTGDDQTQLEERIKWVAHSNQFFNSGLNS